MDLYLQGKVEQMIGQQRVFDEYLRDQGGSVDDKQLNQQIRSNRQYVSAVDSVYKAIVDTVRGNVRDGASTPPSGHRPTHIHTQPNAAVAPASSASASTGGGMAPHDIELDDADGVLNDSNLSNSYSLGTSLLHNFTIFVDGASVEDINGAYEFYRMNDGAASFIKHVETTQGSVCYMIYRCAMQVSTSEADSHLESHQWFISTPPPPRTPGDLIMPGTNEDKDYYTANDTNANNNQQSPGRPTLNMYAEFMPPRDNWMCEEGIPGVAPYIIFISSLTTSATNSTINTPNRLHTPNRGVSGGGGNAFSPASSGSIQHLLSRSGSGGTGNDNWPGSNFPIQPQPPSRNSSGDSFSSTAAMNIDDERDSDRIGIALNSGGSLLGSDIPDYDIDSHSDAGSISGSVSVSGSDRYDLLEEDAI